VGLPAGASLLPTFPPSSSHANTCINLAHALSLSGARVCALFRAPSPSRPPALPPCPPHSLSVLPSCVGSEQAAWQLEGAARAREREGAERERARTREREGAERERARAREREGAERERARAREREGDLRVIGRHRRALLYYRSQIKPLLLPLLLLLLLPLQEKRNQRQPRPHLAADYKQVALALSLSLPPSRPHSRLPDPRALRLLNPKP